MSEYEILDLMATVGGHQETVIGHIIGLHLAMVVGVFYFLHRAGRWMKTGVLLLYTLGYASFVSVLLDQAAFFKAGGEALMEIAAENVGMTALGARIVTQMNEPGGGAPTILFYAALVAIWLGTAAFLIFWKRPSDS